MRGVSHRSSNFVPDNRKPLRRKAVEGCALVGRRNSDGRASAPDKYYYDEVHVHVLNSRPSTYLQSHSTAACLTCWATVSRGGRRGEAGPVILRAPRGRSQIGRASCRERGSGVGGAVSSH